jgi:hypothetical protein
MPPPSVTPRPFVVRCSARGPKIHPLPQPLDHPVSQEVDIETGVGFARRRTP